MQRYCEWRLPEADYIPIAIPQEYLLLADDWYLIAAAFEWG